VIAATTSIGPFLGREADAMLALLVSRAVSLRTVRSKKKNSSSLLAKR
jgi:hypothetical protein